MRLKTEFVGAKEVSEICQVGLTKAYDIIKNLNIELEKKGFMTLRGKTNRKYLLERFKIEEVS